MTLCCNDLKKEKKEKLSKTDVNIDVTRDLTQAQIVVSALDLAVQVCEFVEYFDSDKEYKIVIYKNLRIKKSPSSKPSAACSAIFLRKNPSPGDKLTE